MARQLAETQTLYGDWRELFREVDRINAVTSTDIRRVANKIFDVNNRTVGYVDTSKTPAGGGK